MVTKTLGPLANPDRIRSKPKTTFVAPDEIVEDRGLFLAGIDPKDEAKRLETELQAKIAYEQATGIISDSTKPTPLDLDPALNLDPDTARKSKIAAKAEKTTIRWLAMGQMVFVGKGDIYCANAMGMIGPDIAKSVGLVAVDIPWLSKYLEEGDKYTALATLLYSVGRLGLMMAVHHDLIPYNDYTKVLIPPIPEKENATKSGNESPAH
jgi:hypothetical protein